MSRKFASGAADSGSTDSPELRSDCTLTIPLSDLNRSWMVIFSTKIKIRGCDLKLSTKLISIGPRHQFGLCTRYAVINVYSQLILYGYGLPYPPHSPETFQITWSGFGVKRSGWEDGITVKVLGLGSTLWIRSEFGAWLVSPETLLNSGFLLAPPWELPLPGSSNRFRVLLTNRAQEGFTAPLLKSYVTWLMFFRASTSQTW